MCDGQCCTKQHLIPVPDNDDETGGMDCLAAYFGALLTRSLCAKSLLPRFAFHALRQIGILVLICLFLFVCAAWIRKKKRNTISFIRSCALEMHKKNR